MQRLGFTALNVMAAESVFIGTAWADEPPGDDDATTAGPADDGFQPAPTAVGPVGVTPAEATPPVISTPPVASQETQESNLGDFLDTHYIPTVGDVFCVGSALLLTGLLARRYHWPSRFMTAVRSWRATR